jgi:hypothetical protein
MLLTTGQDANKRKPNGQFEQIIQCVEQPRTDEVVEPGAKPRKQCANRNALTTPAIPAANTCTTAPEPRAMRAVVVVSDGGAYLATPMRRKDSPIGASRHSATTN